MNKTPLSPLSVNSEIPQKLAEIIDKALEKDRDLRYQVASEIRADLKRLKRDTESGRSLSPATPLLEQPAPYKRPSSHIPLATGGLARRRRSVVVAGAAVAVCVLLGMIFWVSRSGRPSRPDLKQRQLTTNSVENAVKNGTISPDGKYLAYTDAKRIYIKLIETDETQVLPQPDALKGENSDWDIGPWFPDGTRFLASAHPSFPITGASSSEEEASIWMVSVLGRPPRKLRDSAAAWSVSPDGSLISFGTNKGKIGDREIWLMDPAAEHAKKLYDTDDNSALCCLIWAQGGERVIYIRSDESGDALVSRALKGGPTTTLVPTSEMKKMTDATWLPDGRVIYSVRESDAIGDTCNLWTKRLDVRTAEVIEKARRITHWVGSCMSSITATADGRRLAFLGWAGHLTSYVADLSVSGTRILRLRRFSLNQSSEGAADWTADSKAIILVSNRSGRFALYKQALNQDTAEPLVTEGYRRDPHATPDGKWVLYLGINQTVEPGVPPPSLSRTETNPVMRVAIDGGPPQMLFTAKPWSLITCAKSPSTLCVIAEPTGDRKQEIISVLDPLKGRGPELTRFALDPNDDRWFSDLSPDGTRVAATRTPTGPIYILSLRGQPTQQIQVKGWSNLENVKWAAHGNSLLVAAGRRGRKTVLHVDFQGNAQALWENAGASGETIGMTSPDGRHLAMQGWTQDGNMWMLENF